MKVLVLINPNSGKKNSKGDIVDAFNVFSRAGYQVSVYVTQACKDATQYVFKYGQDYDMICVFGGDGTLNEVTNGLMPLSTRPVLGYFPSGTMNDFGSNFGLDSNILHCANIICAGHTTSFDVGKINSAYFNYVAGFGAFCNVSYETRRDLKKQFGNVAYIVKALSELPGLHPYHVKMWIDDEYIEKDLMFGLIINGNRVAGFDLVQNDPKALMDGKFDILLVEFTPNLLELYNYPLGVLLLNSSFKYVSRYQASSIRIESKTALNWTLDGEKGDLDTCVEITNIPLALKIFSSDE